MGRYDVCEVNGLLGKTMVSVDVSENEQSIRFKSNEGEVWVMQHHQDCCESVYIEDICGDIGDLIGSPILQTEEVTHSDEMPSGVTPPEYYDKDSWTWTFYKFATIKGYVTIRWFGTSNGYYSERVDFERVS